MSVSNKTTGKYRPDFKNLRPGDILHVRSRDWYDRHQLGGIVVVPIRGYSFTEEMAEFCGRTVEVSFADPSGYHIHLKETPGMIWTDYMFEEYPDIFPDGSQNQRPRIFINVDLNDFMVQPPGETEPHPVEITQLETLLD